MPQFLPVDFSLVSDGPDSGLVGWLVLYPQ
jgi:hypothetical protein